MVAKVVDQMYGRAWQQGDRGSRDKQEAENHENLIGGYSQHLPLSHNTVKSMLVSNQ